MSIAKNLERIKKAKYAIRNAAVAKGAVISETARIDEYAPAIAKISTSGGEAVDLSFVTAAASDILSGKVGADANGKPISGSMPYSNIGVTGNVVLIQRGYTPEDETVVIPEAQAPEVSGNVVTIHSGYNAEETELIVGTAKAATTITPGTSAQTVAAGTYLSGKLTVSGDADLKAANIKKGVKIFNVTGDYEGEGGTFGLAKVTEFSPATEAFPGLSQIVVSGLGDSYDSANGTYNVTAETEKETDIFKRIYKHASGEWYIWGEYEPEYDEGYFYIGVAPDSGNLCCWTSEEFSDGEYYFEDWDSGDSFDVSLDVTKTTYPATDMVLKGVMAKRFDAELGAWVIGTSEFSLGACNTPQEGCLYVITDNCTVGNAVASDAADAIPTGFTSNTSISGYIINQSSGSGSYPQAYVVFNQNYTQGDYAWWTGSVGISESNPGWFSIEVPVAFVPSGIWIMNEIETPENFKTATFQGSDDGSAWDDLYTVSDSPNNRGYQQEHFFNCNKAYKHFRMLFTASHTSGVSVQAFKIYKKGFIEEE